MNEPSAEPSRPTIKPSLLNKWVLIGAYILLVLCLTALLVDSFLEHDFRCLLLVGIVMSVIAWMNRSKWLSRPKKS
jgi:hypothetical protein